MSSKSLKRIESRGSQPTTLLWKLNSLGMPEPAAYSLTSLVSIHTVHRRRAPCEVWSAMTLRAAEGGFSKFMSFLTGTIFLLLIIPIVLLQQPHM